MLNLQDNPSLDMKKKIITFIAIFFLSAIAAQDMSAQLTKGSKSFGVKTGYATLNHTATAGIELHYAFSEHFVLAPNIDYVFRNEGLDGLLFNLDYHGPWELGNSGKWYFYHILGLNYASWSTHSKIGPNDEGRHEDDDVTTRFNRFGLNFGAGFAYYVTPTLKLSLQGKFNWIKDHNTGLFNLGISYVF